jgi:hypothetical protein
MPLNISGLKCDYCDYRDDSVPYSAYQKSIGKPCPKCGENLLTQQEFEKCERILKRVSRFEKVLSVTKFINPFYYLRLLFKIEQSETKMTIEFPKRKIK